MRFTIFDRREQMRNREPTTYQSFWRNREAEGGLLSYGIDRFKGSDIERKLVYSPKMDRRKRESESGQVGGLKASKPLGRNDKVAA